uniref:Palmitoyltransferase n=1 Tax=Steinernema glaseri TaxID=37863 RepID=A0A1I7Z0S6_9BILA
MIFRRDPCGILCAAITYASLVYADYVVINWLVIPTFPDSPLGAIHVAVFNTLLFLALVAHTRAMLTDPGIVPINKNTHVNNRRLTNAAMRPSSDEDDDSDSDREAMMVSPGQRFVGEDWSVCTRCESFRPPRAHHCRVCRRCVRKMDHHCPWVNNCVGEFNQKYFLQFLLYVALSSAYAIGLIITAWLYHDEHGLTGAKGPYGIPVHHKKILHSIFLTIESALFGMFVLAVSCDQLQAIFNDETAVESVQRRGSRAYRQRRMRSKCDQLREVCGHGHWFIWLLPCSTTRSERDLVNFPQESHFTV